MALKDYADREEILLVGSSSTAPSLAIPNDNIIRLVTDDTCQGKVMAEVLASRNIKDLIPIYRDDLWGQDLLNATRESFEARNGWIKEISLQILPHAHCMFSPTVIVPDQLSLPVARFSIKLQSLWFLKGGL